MSDDTDRNIHPLLQQGKIMAMPGVYDVLSAKVAERVGFPGVVLTGYGFAASYLGEPDFGLFTQTEILDTARRIIGAVNVGVIVDGDTGHGGPLNVQRMVRELIMMGAAGVILEDQQWPKRCGHMRGKSVIEAEEHAAKIRAAVDARGDQHLMITARTDSLATHGIDEAIRRAKLYKEAGADVLFVEGPEDRVQLERIGKELPGPLAVNLIEGGTTPMCSLEDLREMGYFSVGFVLSGLYAVTRALEDTYRTIRSNGSSAGINMMQFEEFNDLIGANERIAIDDQFKT
ncbi:MAG: isocitrate lyase/PEP mutase family protein [Candidatus Hydrogenedentota bacterium]